MQIKYNFVDIASIVRRLRKIDNKVAHDIAEELGRKGEKC